MKCLLLDTIEYKAKKPKKNEVEHLKDCLVVLITFENSDSNKQIEELIEEVKKIAKEFNTKKIMLGPFAHLSSNLLKPTKAKALLNSVENKLKDKFNLLVSEFAVEKGLLLNVRPRKFNIRFRSF